MSLLAALQYTKLGPFYSIAFYPTGRLGREIFCTGASEDGGVRKEEGKLSQYKPYSGAVGI